MADKARTMAISKYYDRNGVLDCMWEKEANLLAYSIECCKMLGALVIREAYATECGVSDLLICYDGRFFAAELKARYGKPTITQLEFIKKVEAAGGHGAVIYTLRNLLELLLQ